MAVDTMPGGASGPRVERAGPAPRSAASAEVSNGRHPLGVPLVAATSLLREEPVWWEE